MPGAALLGPRTQRHRPVNGIESPDVRAIGTHPRACAASTPDPDPPTPRHDDSIEFVVVAVPAHNEADRIGRCLASIDHAARRWGGPVVTVVAADACTDATVTIATSLQTRAMSITVVDGRWRRASPTRRAAVAHTMESSRDGCGDEHTWIANTDADCVVDDDRLIRQVAEAERGADVVAGVVTLDPRDTSSTLQAAFAAHYHRRRGDRPHTHAANLGIRASAYRQVGGWRASTSIGEEHHLMRAAADRDLRIVCLDDLSVHTSGRTSGRVPGGLASVLRRLQGTDTTLSDSA